MRERLLKEGRHNDQLVEKLVMYAFVQLSRILGTSRSYYVKRKVLTTVWPSIPVGGANFLFFKSAAKNEVSPFFKFIKEFKTTDTNMTVASNFAVSINDMFLS